MSRLAGSGEDCFNAGLMPSPLGHALAGVAAGWLVAGRPAFRPSLPPRPIPTAASSWWRDVLAFALLGALPDLDLLAGMHSMHTHSLGAVLAVGFLAWSLTRKRRLALACALAWGSHILLDWLGSDTSPPIGIMALWPITAAHYQSDLHVFDAISRRYWLPEQFIVGNLHAIAREVAIVLPFVIGVWWGRGRSRPTGVGS
jgi:LexA-binding, inner membrane-associated putative hydrolase